MRQLRRRPEGAGKGDAARKRRHILRAFAAFLLAAAVAGCPFPARAETRADIHNAQQKKSELEKEKKDAESLLSELNAAKSDLNSYIRKLDTELAQIQGEIEGLDAQIEDLDAQIGEKEEELAEAEEALERAKNVLEKQTEDMKLRIKYMYERSDTGLLDTIFETDSLVDLLNHAEYVGKINLYDRRKLKEYGDTKEEIEAAKEEIVRVRSELGEARDGVAALKEEADGRRRDVETLLEGKKSEVASYEAKIGTAQSRISEYEKAIKEQEDTIRAIEAEIKRREEEARKAAEAAGKAYKTVDLGDIRFVWPCPSSRRITSYFGDRESPTEGASTDHKGIDIGAGTGSAIVAAAPGEVMISQYSSSAGNYIMINHGGSVYTVYMHCSELLVGVGDYVDQGQTIGKVGSTGYSTGPHLHFGIRAAGSYLNPLAYVSP